MKKKPILAAAALAFSAAFASPLWAQEISSEAVIQACRAQPESCSSLVESFISQSGLSGEALVSELTDLAEHLIALVGDLGEVQGINLRGILQAIVRVVEEVRTIDPEAADQILAEAEQTAAEIGEELPQEASDQ